MARPTEGASSPGLPCDKARPAPEPVTAKQRQTKGQQQEHTLPTHPEARQRDGRQKHQKLRSPDPAKQAGQALKRRVGLGHRGDPFRSHGQEGPRFGAK